MKRWTFKEIKRAMRIASRGMFYSAWDPTIGDYNRFSARAFYRALKQSRRASKQ